MRTLKPWLLGMLFVLACDNNDGDGYVYGPDGYPRDAPRGGDVRQGYPVPPNVCRTQPEECQGGPGSYCRDNLDCAEALFCCTEHENCGDGMCTRACTADRDCPVDMLCEHEKCFYACNVDNDCAGGMTCEHGKRVCEY